VDILNFDFEIKNRNKKRLFQTEKAILKIYKNLSNTF